ncbi:MAG TPA: hypothetical protein DCP24_10720 [Nitrospiraceae bacterium]|nr:hypothetical protein [Nitrospiraceae bacterium]
MTEEPMENKNEELKDTCAEINALLKQIEAIKTEWESSVDSIDYMLMLVDTEDRIQRCNKALINFAGKAYSDIVGKNFKFFLKEYGISLDKRDISENGIDIFLENSQKWFNIAFHPYKDRNTDKIIGAVVTINDITEFKMLTDSLEITNAAISRERQELQFAVDEIDFLLREVEDKKDLSVRFAAPGVSESDVIYRISAHFNNMMNMLESQHKELEKAYGDLKAAQSQILQQEKMASIGQLAAGVAHEINNPMGFIISNLGTLGKYVDRLKEFMHIQSAFITSEQSKELEESRKRLKIDYIIEDTNQLLKESLDGAERVKKIVQNLKSFSHIDESEWKIADINAGIENTINIVWNELKYKAAVKKEYGDIPPTKCNPGQLNQVFMNILVNAAHAIEKQGEITIKTRHENNNIFVSISDTGSGIPADKINRIFEPFFTTKEVGKGTGLGLSIAYDIIKNHNGDIIVESEVGKGTTFTVRIPVVEK